MEVPVKADDDVQLSHEPLVVAEDVEGTHEVSENSPEPHLIAKNKEIETEVLETSPEVQTADEERKTLSEPQTENEVAVSRPSLESVWESLQSAAVSQSASLDPQDASQEKGTVGEDSQLSPEPQRIPEITGRKPSALRTRTSNRVKRNVTFKDDFEKPEEPRVQKSGNQRRDGEQWQKIPLGCVGLLLSVALAFLVVYMATPSMPTKPRIWTSAELEKYNGTNNKPPVLLSVLGNVFDVSKGWKHYGPGGSYHHFVGRDASRAFVSGNFTDDGLTDSLEGLTPSELLGKASWIFLQQRWITNQKVTFSGEEDKAGVED
uniref:Cytochrome b5 heme-binding domain-containing protein n=1 Tax=Physcomitrium patens TaxID=3218 RepID=A0A7I4C991_PHYPA